MVEIESAGRGVPGAVVVRSRKPSTAENNANIASTQYQPPADECILPVAGGPGDFATGQRLERQIMRVHALGPRPLAELLAEIATATGEPGLIAARVEAYAGLDPEIVRAVGGDKFPPIPPELIR